VSPAAWRVTLLAVLVLMAGAGAQPAFARAQHDPPQKLLDVPYLPQSEALCGGAAAAMVMRFWGARRIYPDTFAPLVDRAARGIRTGALADALEGRSWSVRAGPGDLRQLHQELERGHPVIALIEDRPGRFHYVVAVGWTSTTVIVHDPARAPFRVLDESGFGRAWAKADRWMLVALPPTKSSDSASLVEPTLSRPGDGGACAARVEDGVRFAEAGDRGSARRTLQEAASACPNESASWREMAGLDALEGNWAAAREHAERAIASDGHDEHAWRVLATAEYVQHNDLAALDAWNHIAEPTADVIDVKGLGRTRYGIVTNALNVPPGTLITPDRLRLAERRARDVPAVAAARVSYHPVADGEAQVDVALVEHAAAPTTRLSWLGMGLHAATERELATTFASVTGGGELVTASWRWWQHRPRYALTFAAPALDRIGGGVWRLEAFRETEAFGAAAFEETRTRVGIGIANWLTPRVRAEGGVALDRYERIGNTGSVSGSLQLWPVTDRLALEGRGDLWLGSASHFGSGALVARWRSSAAATGASWLANGGAQMASEDAPQLLWPGADTGHARDILLRAHPLLDEGVITGGVFGRQLLHARVEWRHWTHPGRWPIRIAPATFVDMARAMRGLPSTDLRTHVDAGAGVRVSLAGIGVMRIDLAKGLRDGRTAFTVGWER
jgi:hypothetical protein